MVIVATAIMAVEMSDIIQPDPATIINCLLLADAAERIREVCMIPERSISTKVNAVMKMNHVPRSSLVSKRAANARHINPSTAAEAFPASDNVCLLRLTFRMPANVPNLKK